ncbi:MAG: VPS10 domain-containing protein, partial [Vicinamibacterales bacterium]
MRNDRRKVAPWQQQAAREASGNRRKIAPWWQQAAREDERSPVRLLAWVGIALCLLGGHGLVVAGAPQDPAPDLPAPINQSDDPLLKPFVWRSIGPANMGGRVDDIAVDETNPSTIYVGFATGGIWKTMNNGTTWTPIFDTYPVSSIGDIGLAPSDPSVLYVGTGEANNRQSSSFGAGVYKSVDGGRQFEYMGLKETQTIARVVVHPKDPNIVYVAAVGHLFGSNPERGLYKTTDGGKTWTNTKFIDNDTGFTDVVIDPSNPNVLFAASYQRRRQPWGFNGGGPGSALWKTTDGAKTWTRLTGNGLPDHPIIGRIGLAIARSKPETIYATIEVGPSGGAGAGVNEDGTLVPPGQGRGGGRGGDPPPPDPKKSGVWRSDDGGKTWRFLSNQGDRWMYYSKIAIDPTNPEIAYQGGAPFFKTVDGGRSWRAVSGIPHSDHHAFWINPRNHDHILLGNDGGLTVTYDQGATWEYVNTMPLGQFYAISVDMRKPYHVCGGLQDNGSFCGPSATRTANGIVNSDWYRIGGGDGFYTQNDPTDWTILYWESQDGNTSRTDLRAGRSTGIRPRPGPPTGRGGASQPAETDGTTTATAPVGTDAPYPLATTAGSNVVPAPPPGTNYRFYWSTPFILSPHNPRTIYLGGDRVFRSLNRGETWTASPDLTNNIGRNDRPIMGVPGTAPMASKHDGAASYSNIVTISESPVIPGVLWAGTNDGNVQVSRDGGATWKNVVGNVNGVPKETHVSRVEASPFDGATAYVSFDGHRTDDHKPYLFVTRDLGETWTSIARNLPEGNINVVKADPKNRNLLYVGTEYGFYISLDGGVEWKRFMTGLPAVRIDDVLVHPRENDLVLATHGRSIWILDDITPLQQLSEQL